MKKHFNTFNKVKDEIVKTKNFTVNHAELIISAGMLTTAICFACMGIRKIGGSLK